MQRDEFFWTSTINKATIVVNAAEGLLSNEAAREAAGGVARLEAKAEKDPALEDEGRAWFKKIETGDEEAISIWQ